MTESTKLASPDTVYGDPTFDPGAGILGAAVTDTTSQAITWLTSALRHDEIPSPPERLRQALEAIPRAQQIVMEARSQLADGANTNPIDAITDDLIAGKDGPTDLLRVIDDSLSRHERTTHVARLVNTVMPLLRDKMPSAIAKALPETLEPIRAEVKRVHTSMTKAAAAIGTLDVTDGEAVATATDEQRAAIAELRDLTRQYNRLRLVQRNLLVAGAEPIGRTTLSATDHTWRKVLSSGVHEFSGVTAGDSGPSVDLPWHARARAIARRSDVWVPTVEQMQSVWQTKIEPRHDSTVGVSALKQTRRESVRPGSFLALP